MNYGFDRVASAWMHLETVTSTFDHQFYSIHQRSKDRSVRLQLISSNVEVNFDFVLIINDSAIMLAVLERIVECREKQQMYMLGDKFFGFNPTLKRHDGGLAFKVCKCQLRNQYHR